METLQKLHKAVGNKDVKELEELLKEGKETAGAGSKQEKPKEDVKDPYKSLPDGESPLELACKTGWLPGVKLLLESGAPVGHEGRQNGDLRCAMLYACENPTDPEIVKLLLQHGADVNCAHEDDDFYRKYWTKQTPLATVVIANNKPVVRILLEQEGTNLTNSVVPAIEKHDMEMITLLVAAGSDVEGGTIGYHIYGNTNPIREEILVLLAEAGLDMDRITQSAVDIVFDWMEHMHYKPEVPKEIQKFRQGQLFKPDSEDLARIATRKRLGRTKPGCTIIPAIRKLPVPEKIKNFLALNSLTD